MKKFLLFLSIFLFTGSSAYAVTLDLTTIGASGSVNGGYFEQINPQSTGTGVIDPFLRIQATGTEEGFNNSVDQFTLDNVAKGGQTYNHDILLSTVPIVNVNNDSYYQFILDINEVANTTASTLSLNELEIWLKDTPITTLTSPKGVYADLTGSGAVKAWDLDFGSDGDSVIELDYILNPGSGAGDMFAYIPVSALGTDGSQYVYLYSEFGTPNSSSDGFEEWATLQQGAAVPEPATMFLFGAGLLALAGISRRKFNQ